MAQTAEYNVIAFDLREALNGKLVTFKAIGRYENIGLTTETGVLRDIGGGYFRTTIGGTTYKILPDGKVAGSDSEHLNLVVATMVDTYGTSQAMTRRDLDPGYTDTGNVSTLGPRDHFAVAVLQAMIGGVDHPEAANDSTILLYSRAAYRWAQGMMIASADSRAGAPATPEPSTVDINASDLQSNTERLLYNMTQLMKDGIATKTKITQIASDAGSLDVKVKEMPAVAISGTPNVNVKELPAVTISGTPSVNVANTPNVLVTNMPASIEVSNMPTEPISVTGINVPSTVSVDNFPSSIAVTGTVSVDNFPEPATQS